MEFSPLKRDREDGSSLGRCVGSTACPHLSQDPEIAPEVGKSKTKPKNPEDPGQTTTFANLCKLQDLLIVCSCWINTLHNSCSVSKPHRHVLAIFLGAADTTGMLPSPQGLCWLCSQCRSWETPNTGCVCARFWDRQTSQGCRVPFPVAIFLHVWPLCPVQPISHLLL